MKFETVSYGDERADTLLLQMTDDHDMELMERETAFIRDLTGGKSFCLRAVHVNSWNHDLSPWKAPAAFGSENFGDGAADTLAYLLKELIPDAEAERAAGRKIFIGGYSLAGLFALWAVCNADCFDGAAAASPSVWFPGFTDYLRESAVHARAVYLSLGDREEKTRNRYLSQVGNAVRGSFDILQQKGIDSVLEWNKGNHFTEPDLRTARAFAWLMNRGGGAPER